MQNACDNDLKLIEGGGVTTAHGFTACGIHAGFRRDPNRLDMALVVADAPCAAAGVFTQNVFCAAPVLFSKSQFERESGNAGYGTMRAVLINSGNANAATGKIGLKRAEEAAETIAYALDCPASEVLVASTGVIGVQLDLEPLVRNAEAAVEALSREGGERASQAIMTTDTVNKQCAVEFEATLEGEAEPRTFRVGGMAKGSGMIMPNMATMIAVITTDAPVLAPHLHEALQAAASASFNKVTVDGDTSTNDTCFAMASGAAAPKACPITPGTQAFEVFQQALTHVCMHLARAMARDGEGATKLVTVNVQGAATAEDADAAARTVANSPLVKTAIAGRDANWGRIAAALGRSGAKFDQSQVDIDIMGIPVCRAGLAQPFSEEEALACFESPEISIDANLHAGPYGTTVWTCDLTHDYISINADYRS